MYVPLRSPLRGYSGRHKGKSFVMFRRNKRQFLRRFVQPSDPKTAHQLIMRQRWTQAKQNWATGPTEAQRQSWKLWAAQHLVPAGLSVSIANVAGYNAFMTIELNRMALGMSPGTAAPEGTVPGRIIGVQQVAADEANTFRFRLMHDHTDLQGAHVLVETTPATLRASRAPREGDLRRAAGMYGESFLELKPSGEFYELRGGIHFVQPGERYGMRFRLLTREAVAGNAVEVDWTRPAFTSELETMALELCGSDGMAEEVPALPAGIAGGTSLGNDASGATSKRAQAKHSRELDAMQKAQLEAYWSMLEFLYNAPWRPPWMKSLKKKNEPPKRTMVIEEILFSGLMPPDG